MNINLIKFSFASAAFLVLALPAHAGLTGDLVGTEYFEGEYTSGAALSIVGPGEEDNLLGTQYFDYGDSSFTIRSTRSLPCIFLEDRWLSLQLTSLDLGAPITSVSFSTSLSGVTETHTATSVTFSWMDQSLPANTYLTADFNGGTPPVPEPETCALMLAGLAAMGAVARRYKGA